MIKNKTGIPKWLVYAGAPVITVAIMLVIYAIRGYYPFGEGTIVDIDLGAAVLPSYTNLYDVLHGNASAFFDWYTAAGHESFSLAALLSPTVYFLLLFPRNALIDAFTLLLVVKLAIIALTSSVFFAKIFKKLPANWIIVFSLMYTFSGFNLQYYTNMEWLDVVALFPLLILAAINMCKGKSIIPFTLLLAYTLVTAFYFSYFIFLFLIVIGGLYIYTLLEKETRKRAIFNLGISSISALVITSPITVSSFFTIVSGSRFEATADTSSASGILDTISSVLNIEIMRDTNKLLMLVGLEFTLVALVLLWSKYRRDKKAPIFFTSAFLLLASQIVFENINLIWHGGSYMHFSMRNGYMLTFVMCCCAAYYCEHYDILYDRKEKHKIISYALPSISVLSFYIVIPFVFVWAGVSHGIGNLNYFSLAGFAAAWTFIYSFIAALCGFVLYRFIGSKRFRTLFTSLLIVAVICINAYGFVGAHTGKSNIKTQYNIQTESSFAKAVKNDDVLDRTNCPDASFCFNYSYLINRGAISNWTHNLNDSIRQAFWDLGFSSYFTMTLDTGGTAFSKALMNIKETVCLTPQNDEEYSLVGVYEDEYLYYENKYTLPLGIVFGNELTELRSDGDIVKYQNSIYSALTGDSRQLFGEADIAEKEYLEQRVDEKKDYDSGVELLTDLKDPIQKITRIKVKIAEKSALYFRLNLGKSVVFRLPDEMTCDIKINGEPFYPTYTGDAEGKGAYPGYFSDNLLELGVFENEIVEIEIKSRDDLNNIELFTMDMDMLDKLCSSYDYENDYTVGDRSFDITVSSDKSGKYLFLPIGYSDNWSCTVNGEEREIEPVLYDFMGVELNEGENNVSLKLSVSRNYIVYGIVLLLLVCFAVSASVIGRKGIRVSDAVMKVFSFLFAAVFFSALLFIYVIPLGYSLYNLIM